MAGPQVQKPRAQQEEEPRAQQEEEPRAQQEEEPRAQGRRDMAMWEGRALPTGLPTAPTISGCPTRKKTLRS
jgi:hypothetical protein